MIPFLVILEIIILCLGATVFIYDHRMRVSEAICSGIILALLTLSFLYQTVFLIGEPKLSFLIEFPLVMGSLILLKRRSNYLKIFWTKIIQFWQENKIITSLLGIALIYLALQVIILPPIGPDFYSYHLPRVLLFQQEKTLFLENVTTVRQSIFAVGWNILSHAFLRFYTDYGLGIFAFLIYLAVGCGTYALARLITSQKIAIATTLTIICMPEVVMQSISMNTDFPLAGVTVFCLLAIYRLYQKPNIFDVVLLILGIAFGLSIKQTFLLFLPTLIVFSGYFLLRKYGFKSWINLLLSYWKLLTLLIFPVVILSQIWLYIYNKNYWGGWFGPPDFVNFVKQQDGIKGGVANFVRYLLSSIDLLESTDWISYYLFHTDLSDLITRIYNQLVYPLVGDAGMIGNSYQFSINWKFLEEYSWYGPFGFLLAIPSIVFCTFKGKNFVKIVGLILFIFFFLLCYKVGWSPWRGRYFSLFFVASGICIAYSLDNMSLWLKDKTDLLLKSIITINLIILFLTISLNENRAIMNLSTIIGVLKSPSGQNIEKLMSNNIWVKTEFGQNRDSKRIAKELENLIPSGVNLALLSNTSGHIYNHLLALHRVHIVPVSYDESGNNHSKQISDYLRTKLVNFDYLLCVDAVECNPENLAISDVSGEVIWRFEPYKTKLLKLN